MKEYTIGEKVYWATIGYTDTYVDCIVCYGSKKVKVILGNDDLIEVECDYCSTGKKNIPTFKANVQEIVIEGKQVTENHNGRQIEYRYDNYLLPESEIFSSKDEAEKKSLEKVEEHNKSHLERQYNAKNSNIKSLSWKLGYHKIQAKKAYSEYEYHTSKYNLLKSI